MIEGESESADSLHEKKNMVGSRAWQIHPPGLACYFCGVNGKLEPCNRSFCALVAKKRDSFSKAFLPTFRFLDPFQTEYIFFIFNIGLLLPLHPCMYSRWLELQELACHSFFLRCGAYFSHAILLKQSIAFLLLWAFVVLFLLSFSRFMINLLWLWCVSWLTNGKKAQG
jgi:hypothetical protein